MCLKSALKNAVRHRVWVELICAVLLSRLRRDGTCFSLFGYYTYSIHDGIKNVVRVYNQLNFGHCKCGTACTSLQTRDRALPFAKKRFRNHISLSNFTFTSTFHLLPTAPGFSFNFGLSKTGKKFVFFIFTNINS